jgi:hypothetical protein
MLASSRTGACAFDACAGSHQPIAVTHRPCAFEHTTVHSFHQRPLHQKQLSTSKLPKCGSKPFNISTSLHTHVHP